MRPRLSLFIFLTFAASSFSADWKPVADSDLKITAPLVEKGADAEAIFWEVRVTDEAVGGYAQTSRQHYLRIKIFSEKGREEAKVELPYTQKEHISNVAGRTIKPDGTVTEMKKDGVFDTDVVRGKKIKVHARSFTLPDVQPGDIIEYQWRVTETDALSQYLRLPLQRSIPLQAVRYYVKPYSSQYVSYVMHSMTLHAEQKPFHDALQGFSMVEYTNMPAFREEPNMPPEDELRAWVLVYYADDGNRTPDKYWRNFARSQYGAFKIQMKIDGEAKKTAAEAAANARTDDEKARAIYAWVQKNVKNVNMAEVSAGERNGFKSNHNSADTLKQGLGTGYDINIVFATLLNAAGIEARMALSGDRGDVFFQPELADRYFLRGEMVAARIDGAWKYFDPATPWIPAGSLMWQQQGTPVLITDPKQLEWSACPMSKPAETVESHKAQLKADIDGSVSGTFEMRYTGHLAAQERRQLAGKTAPERDQNLIERMKNQFGEPEIKDVKWDGIEDTGKPVSVSFTMRVPNYIQRTGRRIFVQPGIFQRGHAARFPQSAREHPIYFQYPWSESDDISIEVPPGFEFDHPEVPGAIKIGTTVSWKAKASILSGKTLVYKREFSWGEDGNIVLPQKVYPDLKKIFDAIHTNDENSFSLKQAGQ